MIDYLLRQLLLLLQPIGLVWAGLIVLAVLFWRRRQRRLAMAASAMVVLLTVVGGTDISFWMLWKLEQPWTSVRLADQPECEAALVLGGFADASPYEAGGVHLTRAGDRVLMGIEAIRTGKAKVLVLGGGWMTFNGRMVAESETVKAWLTAWNLPAGHEIVSLRPCADTRDEALHFAALAKDRGWERVLLITSATHMRRAAATFRAVGVEPVPVPCNYLSIAFTEPGPVRIGIPGVTGFDNFGVWSHEIVGRLMYWRRGWLDESSPR